LIFVATSIAEIGEIAEFFAFRGRRIAHDRTGGSGRQRLPRLDSVP
jgi:hypothetical protein